MRCSAKSVTMGSPHIIFWEGLMHPPVFSSLELSKTTLVKAVVEEIDQRGKVLSSRIHSIEEKMSKMSNGKAEQRVPF